MKKKLLVLLVLALGGVLCLSASAQTLGISLDDKLYSFTGGEGTYKVDGKTFIIGKDMVTVQEAGKADRVLEIGRTVDMETVQDTAALWVVESVETREYSTAEEDVAEEECVAVIEDERELTEDEGRELAQQMTSNEAIEEDLNPKEMQAFFASYAPYGLKYDVEENVLYYQGKRVRQFTDVLQCDDGTMENGSCSMKCACFESGEVDVQTVRDYEKLDDQGYGTLMGVTITVEEIE